MLPPGIVAVPGERVGELRPHFPDIPRAPGRIRVARACLTYELVPLASTSALSGCKPFGWLCPRSLA
jgi:hypothetical protein